MSVAVFAGTFDPFTVGHLDIVRRASTHFETLYVSVCPNPGKQLPRFSLEQRLELIRDAVRGIDNVRVAHFEGLHSPRDKKRAGCRIRAYARSRQQKA